MRWLLGRDPGDCAVCGADLQHGASWCGACGARTDAAAGDQGATSPRTGGTGPVAVAEADAGAAPARDGLRGRRTTAALVLLVLAALVAAQMLRDVPEEPLLGTVGVPTGMSASGPPPDGLGVAWEHELAQPGDDLGGALGGRSPEVAVADGRIRVGERVVAADSGRLVRVSAQAGPTDAGARAQLVGDDVVVVDSMTGNVITRAALAPAGAELLGDGSSAHARSGDVSLFVSGADDVVLLRDDGEVVATLSGYPAQWLDRAVDAPAAFPLRPLDDYSGDGDLPPEVVLVSAADGTELGSYSADEQLVVEVVGDVALVAATDDRLGRAGEQPSWDVRLLDARTGDPRDRLELASTEAPRLLGAFGDGTVAVGTRAGRLVTVLGVPQAGATRRLAQVYAARTGDVLYNPDSAVLETVGLTGDRLVVLTHDAEHVAALDATGVVRWNAPASGATFLAVGDEHVALLPDDPMRPTRVLRARDGEAVVTVPSAIPAWVGHGELAWAPVAELGGHVGLGPAPHSEPLQASLGTTIWLDLATGRPEPVDDLVERHLGGAALDTDGSWVLHGTTPATEGTGPGGARPVLSRDRGGSVLQVLDPDEGPRSFELDLPDAGAVASYYTEVVGVSARHLAVFSQGLEERHRTATHLLDRTTGEVIVVAGVHGFTLRHDVLVGVVPDREAGRMGQLVAVDPITGEQRWERAIDDEYRFRGGRLLVDDDLVVSVHDLGVTATALGDGREAWVHDADAELAQFGALGPSHTVVVTTDGTVVALDRSDGAERWRTPVGAPVASLTTAGDDVLVGTVDGVVVHLDADGGEVQRVAVGTGAVTAVAALGDTVVAVAEGVAVGLRLGGTGITQRDEVDLP